MRFDSSSTSEVKKLDMDVEFEIGPTYGKRRSLWMMTEKGRLNFYVNRDEDCLDVLYVRSEEPGHMSKMIGSIVKQLPVNSVRFIAPFDDADKEKTDLLGAELEKRGIARRKDSPKNDRNIRDVLHGYEEVVAEYYDGVEYTMLILEWDTEKHN